MRDFNILSYVGSSLWALTPEKWAEMLPALVRHAKGERLNGDELQAFLNAREARPAVTQQHGVSVVPIRGVISHRGDAMEDSSGGTSCEKISAMFRRALAEDSASILLDIDSPGGTVTGIQELADEMRVGKGCGTKRVVAMVNGMACSAAYWLAAQADEIVSIPSGYTGSIGVFSAHQDVSAMLEKEGVKITLIKAGKFKTENNPFEPLSDEGKAEIQKRVDEAYAQFTKDVAKGRRVGIADVRNGYGEGRALTAKDALAAGMIDRIATVDAVLAGLLSGKASPAGARAEEPLPDLVAAVTDAGLDSEMESRLR